MIKRFYRDGNIIESGKFESGVKSGIWEYNLNFSKDVNVKTWNSDYWKLDDSTNKVNFRIDYLSDPSPDSFKLIKMGVPE